MDKLRECPFCGSLKLKHCYVFVKCENCGAEGPVTNDKQNDDHADYIDRENASKKWNARYNSGFETVDQYKKRTGEEWEGPVWLKCKNKDYEWVLISKKQNTKYMDKWEIQVIANQNGKPPKGWVPE